MIIIKLLLLINFINSFIIIIVINIMIFIISIIIIAIFRVLLSIIFKLLFSFAADAEKARQEAADERQFYVFT